MSLLYLFYVVYASFAISKHAAHERYPKWALEETKWAFTKALFNAKHDK